MTVETYDYRPNRHHTRKATRVRFPSGGCVSFDERLSKRDALRQIERMRTGSTRERLLILAAENGIEK
jgi:hypothetical protein